MSTFVERLLQAARHAGVEETQKAIAASLGLKKQTVNRWFNEGGEPSADNLLDIEAKWGVDGKWLKKGEGEMVPTISVLSPDERALLKDYRKALPRVRDVIRNMARAARKSVVTIAALIPPLLVPQPSDAGVLHKIYYIHQQVTHCAQNVLRWLMGAVPQIKFS
jgi:transcriptional regulator with XRE-family HTH domain